MSEVEFKTSAIHRRTLQLMAQNSNSRPVSEYDAMAGISREQFAAMPPLDRAHFLRKARRLSGLSPDKPQPGRLK